MRDPIAGRMPIPRAATRLPAATGKHVTKLDKRVDAWAAVYESGIAFGSPETLMLFHPVSGVEQCLEPGD
jgi:hypothetical protein